MKRGTKGFTLVELMIVVAIIGILAAIAIPNFLRYQLRTKASERRINLEAIFKAEEALRQSERVVIAGSTPGQYLAFAAAVPTGTVGVGKLPWSANDLQVAQQIDWMVQGSTYGRYMVATNTTAPFVAVAMCAWTDIDGDTSVYGGDGMWNPQVATNGGEQTAPPAAPCDAKVNTGVHNFTYTHTVDPMGRPQQLSADNVF